MSIDKLLKEQKRKEIAEMTKKAIVETAKATGTDPEANLKAARDEFKRVLRTMELPFTLLTIRAFIEGANYVKVSGLQSEMAVSLLFVFEEEMLQEKAEKLKNLTGI